MKQIAENRIFTVLSGSHTRGDEIAVLLELSHIPESGQDSGGGMWREGREGEQKGRQAREGGSWKRQGGGKGTGRKGNGHVSNEGLGFEHHDPGQGHPRGLYLCQSPVTRGIQF